MDAATGPSLRPRPVVLVVLDGFGIGALPEWDAIAAARMPAWRSLLDRWPHSRLGASAEAVGLPAGQMGNSEVGHLNLGAGRPVLQDLPRIDASIADRTFFTRPAFLQACARARDGGGGVLHLMSLIGPGGVHANDRHLVALAEVAAGEQVGSVRLHAWLDGRDTPPRSALGFVTDLEARLAMAHPNARLATVGGRYYAMDRDQRWDRIKTAYDAMVHGQGLTATSAVAAVEAAYARGENDEFVTPTVISPGAPMTTDDPLIVCNFRADRVRQMVRALALPDFDAFDRTSPSGRRPPSHLPVVTMTAYEAGLPVEVAFPPETVPSLAAAFAGLGWRQFHVAETEKYAHVTYFLNGGVEAAWPGEERVLVPSPRVATYDLQPGMSAEGVTDALVAAIRGRQHDFLVANYANADMVGHTGVWEATVTAVEALDGCLARIVAALAEVDSVPPIAADAGVAGSLLCVTADHGNADQMRDAEGYPVTAHSLNPVPLLLAGAAMAGRGLDDGVLADVAPTLLEVLALAPWEGMTGRSLLVDGRLDIDGRLDR
ncbi:2,3-bisphosphoglycerate-independent phosphoglycerate mutase [soil metagenome]